MSTDRDRRRSEAILAAGLASSALSGERPVESTVLATRLLEMAGEVQRLHFVLDEIIKLYTTVAEPLASYLKETGDL